jgi:prevent-host-death family protein
MSTSNETTVGAYEAKSHFSQLLERVEAGEQITITRHGAPVAQLVPIRPHASPDSRRAVISSMRELASRNRLGGLSIKELIAEGRR